MFTVSLSKPVFVLYSGLIASGYDLTCVDAAGPLYGVISAIKVMDWDPDALTYFSKARLHHGGVNPYWPRVAMLLHASFHLEPLTGRELPPGPAQVPAVVMKAIKSFPVDESQKKDDTINWVRVYPRAHAAFDGHPAMASLWMRYQQAMGPNCLQSFEQAAADALSSLEMALGIKSDTKGHGLPRLNVVPNPLQSPFLADFVRQGDTLHAVVAEPNLTSIVHELLHSIFADALQDSRTAVLDSRYLFTPALLSSMTKLQYAWDGGDESWLRVFEETLVRAASIWVKYAAKEAWEPVEADPRDQLFADVLPKQERDATFGQSDSKRVTTPETRRAARLEARRDAWRDARREASLGFIYVPPVLRVFRDNWHNRGFHQVGPFIEDCLKECALVTPEMPLKNGADLS